MNVLVTGATGFIGVHLVRRLARDERFGRILCMPRATGGASAKVVPVLARLEDIASLRLDHPVDAVVHLAAVWRTADTAHIDRVNREGTQAVISMCKANGIPGLVLVSTLNVKLRCRGAYAESKLAAEESVRESGLRYRIVRPALVYGPGDHGLSRLVRLVDRGVPVPVFGDGRALEQPIHVDELVECLARMLLDGWRDDVVELGGSERLAYDRMLDLIARSGGRAHARKLHLAAGPFLAVARLLERLGLPMPVTSEQVAHVAEDLVADPGRRTACADVEFRTFEQNMADYRGVAAR